MFHQMSPRRPSILPLSLVCWSWTTPDPLDGTVLWSAPPRLRRSDEVTDQLGRPRYRLVNLIEDNPPPAAVGERSRTRRFEHFELGISRAVLDADRRFNGGDGVFALCQTMEMKYARTFSDPSTAGGPSSRWVVVPHDGDEQTVSVRMGTNLYLPTADEPAEGTVTVAWAVSDGPEQLITLPSWPCLRTVDGCVELVQRPVGVYAAQRRLVLGWDDRDAPVSLSGGPGAAAGRIVIDLHKVREAWREDEVHVVEHPVDEGMVTVRLARSAAVPKVVEPGRPAAPVSASVRRAPRTPPATDAYGRREPSFDPPARRAAVAGIGAGAGTSATASVAGTQEAQDGLTLVRPLPAKPVATGAPRADEGLTLIRPIRGGAVEAGRVPRPPRSEVSVIALALGRVDGASRSPAVSGWELALDGQGVPIAPGADIEPAFRLRAAPDWSQLLWRHPGDAKWRTFAGDRAQRRLPLPGGAVLAPVPPSLRDRYHAFLHLPDPRPLPVADGVRHRFGRTGGDVGDDRPKLTFGLLAVPGSLGLGNNQQASVEMMNLSREHGVLHAEHGQLHVALTAGSTPVWKVADGEVAATLEPGSGDELVLTIGEAFLVGGYLVSFGES